MPEPTSHPPDSVRAARAAVQLGRTVSVALKNADLTPAGYRILAYLVTGDHAAKVLAAKLMVSRPTVTATLDWLEPRGYVTRTPDADDRRRVEIAITAQGRRALARADQLVAERLAEVVGIFDTERVAEVMSVLHAVGEALNVYRAREVDPKTGQIRDPMA